LIEEKPSPEIMPHRLPPSQEYGFVSVYQKSCLIKVKVKVWTLAIAPLT